MPNEQNLIPMDRRSKSEARELGRAGGKEKERGQTSGYASLLFFEKEVIT